MENTIELNEINEVDLGDDALIANPTPRSGVATSTECTPDEPVVVEIESESGDGDGDGDGDGTGSMFRAVFEAGAGAGTRARAVAGAVAGAGGEGGSVAFQKKER
jgi:hypothetical protein